MPSVTYTISAEKWADYKAGFLKTYPVPVNQQGEPLYSDADWVREVGKRFFVRAYVVGKKRLAQEGAVIDEEIIVESL